MKKYLISAGLIIGACVLFALKSPKVKPTEASEPAPIATINYEKELVKMGFGSVPKFKGNMEREKIDFYKTKFGLEFMSVDLLSELAEANNFIIGPSERFTGEIPADKQIEIVNNEGRVHDFILGYVIRWASGGEVYVENRYVKRSPKLNDFEYAEDNITHNGRDVLGLDAKDMFRFVKFNPIYVVAPAKKFNTDGMELTQSQMLVPVNKDPIVVARVDGGWVKLASWE